MKGKTCVITGANSGIGFEAAKALAQKGARIVMVARNHARGEAAKQVIQSLATAPVELLIADLAVVSETRDLVQSISDVCDRVDVLVNNAGVAYASRTVTAEGNDATFVINVLAPFILSLGLAPQLERSAPARIVNVSSPAHKAGKIDIGNLQLENGYSRMKAYANSKLALNLVTFELSRRLEGTGVTCNAVDPGFVNTRPSYATSGEILVGKLMSPFGKSPEKGALPSVHAASAPELETVSGKYIDARLRHIEASRESYDQDLAVRLWEELERIVNR